MLPSTLKMEAVCSSETLVFMHKTTRRKNSIDHNLKSLIILTVFGEKCKLFTVFLNHNTLNGLIRYEGQYRL
jgi:hypothetical protein